MSMNFSRVSRLLIVAVAINLFPFAAHAGNKFANQFVEFELPPQWECVLEGAEWVCQSKNEAKKRDAIIVLAAKLKGDQDSLDQYRSYLKAPKTYTSLQGRSVKSDPKYARDANINGHPWIDSLHLESEIPGFYTRYLATIKADIGVLVTYSVNKTKYSDYTLDFDNMVKTLKVFRKAGAINTSDPNKNFEKTQIPTGITDVSVFPGQQAIQGGSEATMEPKSSDNSLFIIIAIAAVVAFIIWKKRRAG